MTGSDCVRHIRRCALLLLTPEERNRLSLADRLLKQADTIRLKPKKQNGEAA